MNPIYSLSVSDLTDRSGIPIITVESDIDLYYHMALSMYAQIEKNNKAGKNTVMILPVGPVFQYRRFLTLLSFRPLDLSKLKLYFMDEYLAHGTDKAVPTDSPLSFRGFIERELIDPLIGKYGFKKDSVHFPDPSAPVEYDHMLEAEGGAGLCHAGVGIVGHIAFNEPMESESITLTDFKGLPTRNLNLTRETITINSNTALRGAYEEIPERAVTIGMKSLLASRRIEIYMNRHWQAAVLRKALLLEPTTEFPVTCFRDHPDISFTVTPEVAAVPDLALK